MELQEVIKSRRSIKKFERDMYIDESALKKAIYEAADAPNHGMREPWRVVYVPKHKLGEMSREVSRYAFPRDHEKQQSHYDAVTNLGGFLAIVMKCDARQREENENYLAVGAFAQNLLLLLYEKGIGTCWKTPEYIFKPKVRATFGVGPDEKLIGFLYLTDLKEEDKFRKVPRKNKAMITEF
ncbi:nitroreductase [Staphylococcus pseudintermedius]|uniref:nitroreductase family protein n=1 Tax=Staphylococcus pseudintermedius TaxID=283734 RepID=UPI0019E9555E|nr:nitroreductase [Staphylococcus pseudintermedius]EGQ3275810.1 nitroreductase [Staphylococcus pseudintermedius]EGQ4336197.1 nitroreductase [Staphylococcus pseudintermedius]EGQ4365956.1 nitroreductase [Staphylococcus pseudintermedius]EHT1758838.1 nitroreductase [Staphylococcus pseudintermedius]EHT7968037.1 nitroreductase [Staphylococcus pseudintermedius]